ncbi:hypothetical protein A2V82_10885 [candidate division KSB1 bacterium RBG_16_48_16]|nr:MAG: hypothetical protein A2V82_10885 [candidate division KSB1 bacterium RBG_16_48_16]
MTIAKEKVVEIVNDLPDQVDIDEVMYRLYLMQKLEAGERDVQEGRLISHDQVVQETASWFAK